MRRLTGKVIDKVTYLWFWKVIGNKKVADNLVEILELGCLEYKRIHANDNTVSLDDLRGGLDQ